MPLLEGDGGVMGLELVEQHLEGLGIVDEVLVFIEQKGDTDGMGGLEMYTRCVAKRIPKGFGDLDATDLVAFGLDPDGSCGIEMAQSIPEQSFKVFLRRLTALWIFPPIRA